MRREERIWISGGEKYSNIIQPALWVLSDSSPAGTCEEVERGGDGDWEEEGDQGDQHGLGEGEPFSSLA